MKISLSIFFLTFAFYGYSQMASLELKVTNFKEDKGQLIVSVFDKAEDFPIEGKELKRIFVDIEDTNDTTINIDLPKGSYAIALLHDLNKDGECNFNFLGIPTEAYGFSQNFRPIISVPGFDETMFIADGHQSLEIKLIQ